MTPVLIKCLLLLIEIHKSFNDGLEVWRVFLDISKAFDKVWHEGLLNSSSGNLLKLLVAFLYCRKQRVVLNDNNRSGRMLTQKFLKALF